MSILRVVEWYYSISFKFFKQTVKPHSAATDDLGMHCLSVSHKKDARLNLGKDNG